MPRTTAINLDVHLQSVRRASEPYHLLMPIGSGGMAEVFLAVTRGPGGFHKLFVVKRLLASVARDPLYREMFLEEARLAARLSHPNVVQTFEVIERGGELAITMEYLDGKPLSEIMRAAAQRKERVDVHLAVRIVADALAGLHHAHEAVDVDGMPLHLVHRDVSPQNVFVTFDGQVKVVDFGIAKAEGSVLRTQTGVIKGKAAYMAPEQLSGDEIDRRVDVFTSGTVLWELLVGRRLMAAGSTAKTLLRLAQEPIPRVRDVAPDVDPELDAIVGRALAREPEARWSSAQEMRDALDAWLVAHRRPVRREDLARFMNETFGALRARVARKIRARVAELFEEHDDDEDQRYSATFVATPRREPAANDDRDNRSSEPPQLTASARLEYAERTARDAARATRLRWFVVAVAAAALWLAGFTRVGDMALRATASLPLLARAPSPAIATTAAAAAAPPPSIAAQTSPPPPAPSSAPPTVAATAAAGSSPTAASTPTAASRSAAASTPAGPATATVVAPTITRAPRRAAPARTPPRRAPHPPAPVADPPPADAQAAPTAPTASAAPGPVSDAFEVP